MAEVEVGDDSPRPMPTALVILAVATMVASFAAMLFLPAGRIDWKLGWVYVGIIVVDMTVTWACLARWNPELIERRMRFGKGIKTWDIIWAALFTPVMMAVYVVAGFDARDRVSSLPTAVWLLGLVIFVPGAGILMWSMVVNPFFEKNVRIQTEHGHRVIDSGPYASVRHPGYVGFIGWMLATPLLLASAWALVPALLSVIAIVIRTALEDRTLYSELSGYAEYTKRVRYRLMPGIW